jgi:hypothetical protein
VCKCKREEIEKNVAKQERKKEGKLDMYEK